MAPMTKGSNFPTAASALNSAREITLSEMTLARRLKQRTQGEFALIRRFEASPASGCSSRASSRTRLGWAAALVASRNVDFIDLNCGCPIDYFTRKGLGASLGRQPNRLRRLVEAMKVLRSPFPSPPRSASAGARETGTIFEQARAAVDGGASAIFVHGRTRNARYRFAADWNAIGEVAAAVPVPVIGNGDLLFPHDIEPLAACQAAPPVMMARAALIKPWIFREARAATGTSPPTSASRCIGGM